MVNCVGDMLCFVFYFCIRLRIVMFFFMVFGVKYGIDVKCDGLLKWLYLLNLLVKKF